MDVELPQDPRSPPLQPDDQGLKIWSCVTCRRRKVKCDRKDPCANCIRNKIECHFPVTGRLPRRSRDPNAWKSPAHKQSELLGRLRRLENLVTELTGQVEDRPSEQLDSRQFMELASSHTARQLPLDQSQIMDGSVGSSGSGVPESLVGEASTDSQTSGEIYEDFGRLVIERAGALQVDKGFWSIFCDEVRTTGERNWFARAVTYCVIFFMCYTVDYFMLLSFVYISKSILTSMLTLMARSNTYFKPFMTTRTLSRTNCHDPRHRKASTEATVTARGLYLEDRKASFAHFQPLPWMICRRYPRRCSIFGSPMLKMSIRSSRSFTYRPWTPSSSSSGPNSVP